MLLAVLLPGQGQETLRERGSVSGPVRTAFLPSHRAPAATPQPGQEATNLPGLIAIVFRESDFNVPDRVEPAAQLNLDTGTRHQRYSQFWRGRLRIPTSKRITFTAEADDGVALEIGGHEVIRGWHGSQRDGQIVAVEGAVLPLEVRYFQNGGEAFLRLFWSWEGKPRELIPAAAFTHTDADAWRAQAISTGREKLAVPAAAPFRQTTPVPAEWSAGPWLLLDERNVLSVEHLRRVVGQPARHGEPIVDGVTDGNFQPYMSVVKDAASGRWRMWYNVPRSPGNWGESSLALIESEVGLRWQRPHRVLTTPPIQFGASVIDEGPAFPEPAKRFKAAWHKNNGLQVAASRDGVTWTELAPGTVLDRKSVV